MKMASDDPGLTASDSSESSDSSSTLVEESVFWSRYDSAVSSFCFQQTVKAVDSDKLVSSLVGEGKLPHRSSIYLWPYFNPPPYLKLTNSQSWNGADLRGYCSC
jgi:hypothetical protein